LKHVPITLLPLKVGELTAKKVQSILDGCLETTSNRAPTTTTDSTMQADDNKNAPFVTVKWPNDVLCDGKKISGALIESANGWFLIGVGINLDYAPDIPTNGPNYGRPSVSIRDYCPSLQETKQQARQVGIDLAYDLHSWLHQDSSNSIGDQEQSASSIVEGWKQWLDWDMELVMRDTPGRERVRLIDVLPDGRVQVMNRDDGTKRTLVSDYFL